MKWLGFQNMAFGHINVVAALTLYTLRVTYRFYPVQCQTTLLSLTPGDFTLSNARLFYSSKGDSLGLKG